MLQGSAGWVGAPHGGKGRVGGWALLGLAFSVIFHILRLPGCCAQVGQPMHSDTLHSFGLFFVCKTGTGGAMWNVYLDGWHWERGRADLAGRACFLEGRGFHSSWIPRREASQAAFSFSVRTLGGPASGQGTSAASHTHPRPQRRRRFPMSTTPPQWNRPHPHSLPTHTRKRGGHGTKRDRRRGGRPSTG